MKRRTFIKNSAFASAAVLVPKFLAALQQNALLTDGSKKLVVVQLSGGNDGLNSVIPFQNDLYYRSRPSLSYTANECIKISDEIGLNPGMESFRKLMDDGYACILNGVGYPNPDLSHFRSMDIWQTGSDSDQAKQAGWIGRYLDANCNDCRAWHAVELDDTLSRALQGEKQSGFAFSSPDLLWNEVKQMQNNEIEKPFEGNLKLDFLYKVRTETIASTQYLYNQSKIFKSTSSYPEHTLGKNLRTIAELICSGSETGVYYVSISGFDTHASQKHKHEQLLKIVSDSLSVFAYDLKQNNRLDETLVMVFSEFGRRLKQNASEGTDHGTANNVFLVGGALKKKGIFNPMPSLADLTDDNLKHSLDFRSIYATILEKWLHADDRLILEKSFDRLNFI